MSSATTLERTKQALQARFWQTDVWVDGPAVVVNFGQGDGAVDVVPGVWVGTTSTSPQSAGFVGCNLAVGRAVRRCRCGAVLRSTDTQSDDGAPEQASLRSGAGCFRQFYCEWRLCR